MPPQTTDLFLLEDLEDGGAASWGEEAGNGMKPAAAQQAAKIPRVGVLRPGNPPSGGFGQQEAFESGLRDLGWTPGTSLLIEYRYAEGKPEGCVAIFVQEVVKGQVLLSVGGIRRPGSRTVRPP